MSSDYDRRSLDQLWDLEYKDLVLSLADDKTRLREVRIVLAARNALESQKLAASTTRATVVMAVATVVMAAATLLGVIP